MTKPTKNLQPGAADDEPAVVLPIHDAKRDSANPPVVGFVSLGCVKNLVDSEKMLGQIALSGAIVSSDEAAADTIVVNTCGFLESARQEALEVIAELAQRKRQGELRRIVVAGCLVQRDGQKLLETIPEIDALVGVHNRDDVVPAVWGSPALGDKPDAGWPLRPVRGSGATPGAHRRGADLCRSSGTPLTPRRGVKGTEPGRYMSSGTEPGRYMSSGTEPGRYIGDYRPQPWSDRGRLRLTPRHYAYVRISEGCNQKCSFCTVPLIRGPLRSKTPDELVAECRELIADGARELILIGQDTTSYGADSGYEPGLAGLLRRLDAESDGARWLRLMYAYPSVFTDAMVDAIAECERVVNYVDIPLQHISDRLLRAMGRQVTRKQTETLLEKIRRWIPGVAIRTTFIVGFPGETEAEFRELVEFVRGFGFDAVGAFEYSLEPETSSARMKGQLDDAVKTERHERLMLTQQEIAFAAAERRVGQTLEVVVDGDSNDGRGLLARHAGQAPEVDAVCLLSEGRWACGEFLPVRVAAAQGYDLIVEPVRRRLRTPGRAL